MKLPKSFKPKNLEKKTEQLSWGSKVAPENRITSFRLANHIPIHEFPDIMPYVQNNVRDMSVASDYTAERLVYIYKDKGLVHYSISEFGMDGKETAKKDTYFFIEDLKTYNPWDGLEVTEG